MSLKRKLRDFGIATLAAVTFASGCAFNSYDSRYREYESRRSGYESFERIDGNRTGLEVIPQRIALRGDFFRIDGRTTDGRRISVYEDIDESNYNLLVNVAADLQKMIELNGQLPEGHPSKKVYVTGKYDFNHDANDILEMETVNVSGNLYYTDPAERSALNIHIGFEFWNQPWWRSHTHVHYPIGLNPWWDPDRVGIIVGYNIGVSTPNGDWDGDGISNWSERYIGTNPYSRDTDYDGLEDLTELWFGTNPRDRDTDNDGYWDGEDPFPLWHLRHHRHHRHWHFWWNHHYHNIEVRHGPIIKHKIPGRQWRDNHNRERERIRYRENVERQEGRTRTKEREYTPRTRDRKYTVPERKAPERRIERERTREIRKVPRERNREIRRTPPERTRERPTKQKTKKENKRTKQSQRGSRSHRTR